MDDLKQLLSNHYGLAKAEVAALEGYANANYKVVMPDGSKFVLKKYLDEPGLPEVLEAESKILASVTNKMAGHFPRPVKTQSGTYLLGPVGLEKNIYRLLHWINGGFLYSATHTPGLLVSLGDLLARLDMMLLTEHQPVLMGRRIIWDLQRLPSLRSSLSLIRSADIRKKVHYFLLQFEEVVIPVLPSLRHSLIHNDANDWNVLVEKDRVTGLIDFVDMVYGPLIQDLAVCLTYALFEKEDPLDWASHMIRGYHAVLPLEKKELDILYYLVAGRLCMSLLNSAASTSADPTNEYLGVSERQAMDLPQQV